MRTLFIMSTAILAMLFVLVVSYLSHPLASQWWYLDAIHRSTQLKK